MTPDIPPTAEAFKSQTRAQWDAAAAGWNRPTPSIHDRLRVPTDAMPAMADVCAGQTVPDVAAGAGDQTLDIAARVGVGGRVVAADISADSLTFIRDAAGPVLHIPAPLTDAARAAAWADIAAQLGVYQTDAGWIGPNVLLSTVGPRQ